MSKWLNRWMMHFANQKKKKKEEKGLELCDSTLYPQNIVYQV